MGVASFLFGNVSEAQTAPTSNSSSKESHGRILSHVESASALVRLWSWGPEVPKPIPAAPLTTMSDRFSTMHLSCFEMCASSLVRDLRQVPGHGLASRRQGDLHARLHQREPLSLLCCGAWRGLLRKASAGFSCRRNNQKWYFDGTSLKTLASADLCADVSWLFLMHPRTGCTTEEQIC